jgi:hypothetical protein
MAVEIPAALIYIFIEEFNQQRSSATIRCKPTCATHFDGVADFRLFI